MHFCEQYPPCQPPDEWWIEVYALANIVETINITFRALQGKQLLLDAQKTASQEATTRTDANCWYKHWWCRASRDSWCFLTWMFSSEYGFSRIIFAEFGVNLCY